MNYNKKLKKKDFVVLGHGDTKSIQIKLETTFKEKQHNSQFI